MNPWKPFPLIRLLIPFLVGVFFALTGVGWYPETRWLIVTSSFLSGIFLLLVLAGKLPFNLRWIHGVTIFLLMFVLGVLTSSSDNELQTANRGSPTANNEQRLANRELCPAEILEPPRHTSRTVKLIVSRYILDTVTNTLSREGRALLFLEKDTNALELQFGDWIMAAISLKPIQDESNPYMFDPSGYYGKKGVLSQGWVRSVDWKPLRLPKQHVIRRWAFILRDRMLNILRKNSVRGEEFAVASAILLGYTGEIGNELRKGFAASGAMHILAVSGMHVGIIFLFLESLLAFLKRRRYGFMIQTFLMLSMIWCYAMITGLSPPVFRATLMLSLIITGKALKRKPDSLNVVGGSMLVILIFDPSLLLHLGFQFSYLAVLGILFLYQPLRNLFPVPNWIVGKIWGLVAVSIAAQIATFPIALYMFHQFPNYFLPTNIIVLPLASLVIYSGIGVLALSPFPAISTLLAKGLIIIVSLLNSTIRFVENLPGSISTGFYPSLPEIVILYLGITAVCSFLFFRNVIWLYLFFALFIVWSMTGIYTDFMRVACSKVVVFQVKGASQYLFVNGRNAVCIKDYQAACSTRYAREVISTYNQAERIERCDNTYLFDGKASDSSINREFDLLSRKGNFLLFLDKRIAIISCVLPSTFTDTMDVDLVIIRKNPDIHIETVVRLFSPEQIVIDPTNSWYNVRNWLEEAELLRIPCHNVMEGAFVWSNRQD